MTPRAAWRAAIPLAFLATAVPIAAWADIPGNALVLSSSCERSDNKIEILPSAGLDHRVAVSGPVHAIVSSSADAPITIEIDCSDEADVTIHVPPAMPVTVHDSGGGDLALGDLAGLVTVSLEGRGDVSAGTLSGFVTLADKGPGDVRIDRLTGQATLVTDGPGDINVGSVDASGATLLTTGPGDIKLGPGHLDRLTAVTHGPGDITVGAVVGSADLNTTGPGDITIARTTGTVEQQQTGEGTIRIGGTATGHGPIWSKTFGRQTGQAAEQARDAMSQARIAMLQAHAGLDAAAAAQLRSRQQAVSPLYLVLIAALGLLAWVGWRSLRSRNRARPDAVHPVADPAISALVQRLGALAHRTGRIESWVTSKEFELHRGFREIGDD